MFFVNLKFSVKNNILSRLDNNKVVNNTHNVYRCIFNLDGSWEGINKFVVFVDGWGNRTNVHLGKGIDDLSCIIPNSVLKGTYFKLSLYGGDLLTTNYVSIGLIQSGYSKNRRRYNNCDDGKDIFVEIFDRLDRCVTRINVDNHCLHIYGEDGLIDSVYLPFADEDSYSRMQEIIDEFGEIIDNQNEELERISDHLKECVTKDGIVFTEDGRLIFY